MDVEAILETIAGIRNSIPAIDDRVSARKVMHDGRCLFPDHLEGADPSRYFKELTVIEALESLAEELAATVRKDVVLRGYYRMLDDLARDSANTRLRFCVEAIRIAYEEDFGTPVPPPALNESPSSDET